MQCPYCNYKESKVIDSRHTDIESIRRRRECESCKKRFTTYEKIVLKSSEKRPVSMEQIEDIIMYIENDINRKGISEIQSDTIGEMVMDKLKDVDEVAYVRFASVYRQFKDINTFVNELKNILIEKGDTNDKLYKL